MLSPIDVHYLVGFLSSVGQPDDVEFELGALVRDVGSETNRDVDVCVTRRSPQGVQCFRGIEVKAERRPLDVIAVEQLCAKLNDMPNLTGRHVVSASGYTTPAARKAEKHGVELLRLEDLDPARHKLGTSLFSPDVSFLQSRVLERNLHTRLDIAFGPRGPTPIAPSSAIVDDNGCPIDNLPDVQAVGNAMARQVADAYQTTPAVAAVEPGVPIPVDCMVTLDRNLRIQAGGRLLPITNAQVTGTVTWRLETINTQLKTLVRHSDNVPFVDCVIAERENGELLLFAAQGVPSRITIGRVTVSERNKTKIKNELWPRRVPTGA